MENKTASKHKKLLAQVIKEIAEYGFGVKPTGVDVRPVISKKWPIAVASSSPDYSYRNLEFGTKGMSRIRNTEIAPTSDMYPNIIAHEIIHLIRPRKTEQETVFMARKTAPMVQRLLKMRLNALKPGEGDRLFK
jgi:hypothetical protein